MLIFYVHFEIVSSTEAFATMNTSADAAVHMDRSLMSPQVVDRKLSSEYFPTHTAIALIDSFLFPI
jgi:hypothetical protein